MAVDDHAGPQSIAGRRRRGSETGHPRDRWEYSPLYYNHMLVSSFTCLSPSGFVPKISEMWLGARPVPCRATDSFRENPVRGARNQKTHREGHDQHSIDRRKANVPPRDGREHRAWPSKTTHGPKASRGAHAGDRTRVTRVTGGNTHHYTTTTSSCPASVVPPPRDKCRKYRRGGSGREPFQAVRPSRSATTPSAAHANKKPIGKGMPNVRSGDGRGTSLVGIVESIARGRRRPRGAPKRSGAPLPGIEPGSPA